MRLALLGMQAGGPGVQLFAADGAFEAGMGQQGRDDRAGLGAEGHAQKQAVALRIGKDLLFDLVTTALRLVEHLIGQGAWPAGGIGIEIGGLAVGIGQFGLGKAVAFDGEGQILELDLMNHPIHGFGQHAAGEREPHGGGGRMGAILGIGGADAGLGRVRPGRASRHRRAAEKHPGADQGAPAQESESVHISPDLVVCVWTRSCIGAIRPAFNLSGVKGCYNEMNNE